MNAEALELRITPRDLERAREGFSPSVPSTVAFRLWVRQKLTDAGFPMAESLGLSDDDAFCITRGRIFRWYDQKDNSLVFTWRPSE